MQHGDSLADALYERFTSQKERRLGRGGFGNSLRALFTPPEEFDATQLHAALHRLKGRGVKDSVLCAVRAAKRARACEYSDAATRSSAREPTKW